MSTNMLLKRVFTRLLTTEAKGTVHPVALNSFNSNLSLYDQVRPSYDQNFVNYFLKDLNLANDTEFLNDKSILELAAGSGKFTLNLIAAGWSDKLTVVEPSTGMLKSFKLNFPQVKNCLEGDSYNIPVEDNTFDAITIAQAFHWFANKEALKEMHRVLKPGGKLGLIWNFDCANKSHVLPDDTSASYKLLLDDPSFKGVVENYLLNDVIAKEIESGKLDRTKTVRRLIELLAAQTRWDMISNYIYQYGQSVPQYMHGEWRKAFQNQSLFKNPTIQEAFNFKYPKLARELVFPYWESRSYITEKSEEEKTEIKKKLEEMMETFDEDAFADDKKKDVMMFLGTHYFVVDVNK